LENFAINILIQKEFIKKLIARDELACKDLYEKYKGQFFGAALRFANNREDAEDMLQEGFVAIFRSLENYKHQGSFEGWLKKVMLNTILSYVRNNYKNIQLEGANKKLSIGPSVNDTLATDHLLNVIRSLPMKYRTVFNLHIIDGYSHKEISTMLEMKESSSRSILTRARKMIIDKLDTENEFEKYIISYGLQA
jgi:RNA polymerase sigma-70 factor (ECF subfamily)